MKFSHLFNLSLFIIHFPSCIESAGLGLTRDPFQLSLYDILTTKMPSTVRIKRCSRSLNFHMMIYIRFHVFMCVINLGHSALSPHLRHLNWSEKVTLSIQSNVVMCVYPKTAANNETDNIPLVRINIIFDFLFRPLFSCFDESIKRVKFCHLSSFWVSFCFAARQPG